MMKYRFLVMALVASALTFAQKKELKKIGKAIENIDFKKASTIFEDIEESTVEDKYKAEYTFYKASLLLGNPNRPTAKNKELQEVITLVDKSKELGYNDEDKISQIKRAASDAIFTEAQKSLSAGNKEAALESVNYLLSLDPTNQIMRENAANLAYQVGNYDSAMLNYEILVEEGYTGIEESAVATDKSNGKKVSFSSLNAAKLAESSGQYENAKKDFSESKLGALTTNLAWVYQNNGNLDKAKKLISDMLEKYPNDANLNLAKADLYLLIGENDKYEAAIKSLNQEIKDPLVFENLGIAAGEKGNWDQAIDYYKKSIDLKKDSYVSQNNIAAAYLNKGNLETTTVDQQIELYTLATGHFEKVVELKPDLSSAKQTLLGLYEFLDMTEKAAALKAKM